MWHVTKGMIVSTRKLKSYWLFSSMLVIIIFLVATITFSVFYKIPFNVHVLPVYSAVMGIEDSGKANVEKEFQKQWFRMQRARIDWKSMLIPCFHVNSVKDKSLIGYGKINETSIPKSFVEYMNIRPAGQFSQVFIRTKTNDGRNKTIGGDFWMVSTRSIYAGTFSDYSLGSTIQYLIGLDCSPCVEKTKIDNIFIIHLNDDGTKNVFGI